MKLTKAQRLVLSSSLSVFLAGCGSPNYSPSEMHMTFEEVESSQPTDRDGIPALVKATPTVPTLSNERGSDTFDVVVTAVPVRDLLFALARDAGVNMDVDASVGGLVTMSAIDQTLDAIIDRISEQIPIRVVRVGNAIIVKNDEPYYKRYHVDYLSISREFSSSASSSGVGDGGSSSVTNTGSNDFWESFEDSIEAILDVEYEAADGEAAVAGAKGNSEKLSDALDSAAKFNPESSTYDFNLNTGILMVYAPERLQKEIQLYIDESMSIIKRQVLLEATIVEVVLNNEYKQGIDWSIFNSLSETGLALYKGAGVGGAVAALQRIVEDFTFSASRTFTAGSDEYKAFINPSSVEDSNNVVTDFTYSETVNADGTVTVQRDYTVARTNQRATHDRSGGLAPVNSAVPGAAFTGAFRLGDISAAVELLEEFGDAKVLSSPRISVLNNQPGLLRVVDEEVYFSVDVEEEVNEDTGNVQNRTYVLTENTVDVGFAMNVLPHITSGDEVFLNLKPSVTRVLGYRQSPSVSGVSGDNSVPITRVRELESVMTLRDGEIAVMGGLLEDRTGDNNQSVPGISKLPGIGNLFQNKSEKTYKTEFVVFIRAKIIKDPSIYGDYSDYRRLLPDSDFIVRDQENNILPPKQEDAR